MSLESALTEFLYKKKIFLKTTVLEFISRVITGENIEIYFKKAPGSESLVEIYTIFLLHIGVESLERVAKAYIEKLKSGRVKPARLLTNIKADFKRLVVDTAVAYATSVESLSTVSPEQSRSDISFDQIPRSHIPEDIPNQTSSDESNIEPLDQYLNIIEQHTTNLTTTFRTMATNANFDWLKPDETDRSIMMSTTEEANYKAMEEVLINVTLTDAIIQDCTTFFAYTGFNATAIRAFLRSREPDEVQLSKDIAQISMIVLTRGTVVSQSGKEKMTTKAVETLIAFMRKYSIKTGKVNKRDLKMTDVTLSRVVASHPEIAFRLILNPRLNRPITVEFMSNIGFESFSPGLRGSYVFSVLPPNPSSFNTVHAGAAAAALAYMTHETQLLRPKTGEAPDIKTDAQKCSAFAMATHQNARHSSASRAAWFSKMAINNATAASWLIKFKDSYGGESIFNSMGFPTFS